MWNKLSQTAATVQWAAVQLSGMAEWEGSSTVGCGIVEWNVLSERVAIQWLRYS